MADLDDLFRLDPYVSPKSLSELCFKQICRNLDIISVKDKRGYRNLLKGLNLPSEICEKIIEYVIRNDTTEEHDSFFTIFKNITATKLKRVKLMKSNLTDQSVQILTNHKLVHLELTDCPNLTRYSIECINANSENLQSLVCHGTSLIIPSELSEYEERGYVFIAPNLQRLALEYVSIDAPAFNILLAGLNLTHLDLSNCFDVGNFDFYHLVPNLVSLVLYNVTINAQAPYFVRNICQLKKLRHLDISQSSPHQGIFENPSKILSTILTELPQLVSLDIGGTNLAGIHTDECKNFDCDTDSMTGVCDIPSLACRMDRPLEFLGLYETPDGACRRRNIPAKMIAGDANEDQVLVAAHVFMDNKEDLLQKVMCDLFYLLRYENCHRIEQALCMILEAMKKHPIHRNIQISGCKMLSHVIYLKDKDKLMKKRIVSTLLNAISIHRDEVIVHYGCLALIQLHIPQDVMSKYEALVKLLLHSARCIKQESFAQRTVLYLLNSLACHVEGREKRLLGQLGCVKTMLHLIQYRIEARIFDDLLELQWSTMWNITDETPINCQRFLDGNGMTLFLKCIKYNSHKEELVRNMMGLLGNVAEVRRLRVHLMQHQYVTVFANLLRFNIEGIEVAYNAAGILAHMASDGVEAWTVEKPSRNKVLEYMIEAIERWDISSERDINYRSFLPLLRLLDVYHTPQCQHWAVWALANFTNVYPKKYCIFVVKEGGIQKLNALMSDPRPFERTKKLAHFVVENCSRYNNAENLNLFES